MFGTLSPSQSIMSDILLLLGCIAKWQW